MLASDREAYAAQALGRLDSGLVAVIVTDHDWPTTLESRQPHEPGQARALGMSAGNDVEHLATGAHGEVLPGPDRAPQLPLQRRARLGRVPVVHGKARDLVLD